MSKRKILAFVGGAALVAGVAGGGTFANFFDIDKVEGSAIDADVLELDMLERNGTAMQHMVFSDMAPGETHLTDQVVALKTEGTERSDAKLSLKYIGIAENDNGCGDPEQEAGDTTCGNDEGELASQLTVRISTYNPTYDAVGNNYSQYNNGNKIQEVYFGSVQDLLDDPNRLDLHTFAPADVDFVGLHIRCVLPSTSTSNLVQSDSSEFDLEFKLEQIVPASTTAGA